MKTLKTQLSKIRVAIEEDDPVRLIGFRALLEAEPDLTIEPIQLAGAGTTLRADVALLAERGGYRLADEIAKVKTAVPAARVLAVGASNEEETILQVIAWGAKGYVNETTSGGELARAIRAVNQGMIWAPRTVLAKLIHGAARYFPGSATVQAASLTGRQKEVLRMLVAGRSNKEIAAPLGIEERTVKAHIAQLMRKVGVRNRIELSVHAVNHFLVPAEEWEGAAAV